jgi:hypothetical protein
MGDGIKFTASVIFHWHVGLEKNTGEISVELQIWNFFQFAFGRL